MHVLVLGGTRFVGRAVTDQALAAGAEVTLFNRGLTAPELYPHLETVVGDRTADLSALAGRRFDLVVDCAGYYPEVVARSAAASRTRSTDTSSSPRSPSTPTRASRRSRAPRCSTTSPTAGARRRASRSCFRNMASARWSPGPG